MKGNTQLVADAASLRAAVEAPPLQVVPGRNRSKADVRRHRFGTIDIAVKDYSARPLLIRHTLGRYLVRRESRVYRAAVGVAGLPLFLGRTGPFTLVTRWIDGQPLARVEHELVTARLFERLETIVAELHGHGIALGDLHHRDVLVGPADAVHVIDLATACVLGARPSMLRRGLFERWVEQDQIALARLRARYCDGDEERAIAAAGTRAARRYRRARGLKRWLARILRGG